MKAAGCELPARAFVSLARICTRLPRFRGRNRALLALFTLLGLARQHIFVDADLKAPLRYRALLDLHSWLQRIAFLDSGYEPDSVEFLLRLHDRLGGTGALLDIGANVGLIAIPTALSLRQKNVETRPLVVALDAVADNIASLKHNIALNDAQEIIDVIEAALGDKAGMVDIQVEGDLKAGEGAGTANILPEGAALDPNGRYVCERIPLRVTTLDALMTERRLPAHCTVIKIDTDGYDLKVLQGGEKFLGLHRPVIFGEFSAHCLAWHGQSIADVICFADQINYRLWRRLSPPQWRFTPEDGSANFVQDLVLAPAEKASLLTPLLSGESSNARVFQ